MSFDQEQQEYWMKILLKQKFLSEFPEHILRLIAQMSSDFPCMPFHVPFPKKN